MSHNSKEHKALNGTPSQSYGVSLAICDHAVLPATRHNWTHPAVPQPHRPVLNFPTLGG